MAPIFEDGNNKKDPPREDDLFDRSSLDTVQYPGYSGTVQYPTFSNTVLYSTGMHNVL